MNRGLDWCAACDVAPVTGPVSTSWPPPVLRQRHNNLGWLALSPPEDVFRIGVTGGTEEEAMAAYNECRAAYQLWLESPDHRKVEAGRLGGLARAARLAPERRSEIARAAAEARWGPARENTDCSDNTPSKLVP